MIKATPAVSSAFVVCLLSVCGVGQAVNVPNFGGPGVSSPGYPDFWGANVDSIFTKNKNGTFTLSVTGSTAACGSNKTLASCSAAIFNFPGGSYLVSNETLSLTANFSSSGVFTSGSYQITGSLPAWSHPTFGTAPQGFGWSATGTQTLLTANLTGDTIDTSAEALGFTEVLTGGWADQKQFGIGTPESVWLYSLLSGSNMLSGDNKSNSAWNNFLAALKSGSGLKASSFAAIGSIATVPLPAAAVLFGSGLLGLLGMARRRRLSVAA